MLDEAFESGRTDRAAGAVVAGARCAVRDQETKLEMRRLGSRTWHRAGSAVLLAVMLLAGLTGGAQAQGRPAATAWSGWKPVPGDESTVLAPTVVSYGGRLYVFVVGADARLQYNRKSSAGWSGWRRVPGRRVPVGRPAVAVYAGRLNVFIVGDALGTVYRTRFDGSTWSGWKVVSTGALVYEIAATRFGTRLYLVAVFADERIMFRRLGPTGWSRWREAGGGGKALFITPAVAVYGEELHVLVQGAGGKTYVDRLSRGGTWSGWSEVPGGSSKSGPAAVGYDGLLRLFVRAQDDRLAENDWNGSTWSGWTFLPDGLTLDAPAVTVHGSRLWLFVRDTSNGIRFNRS